MSFQQHIMIGYLSKFLWFRLQTWHWFELVMHIHTNQFFLLSSCLEDFFRLILNSLAFCSSANLLRLSCAWWTVDANESSFFWSEIFAPDLSDKLFNDGSVVIFLFRSALEIFLPNLSDIDGSVVIFFNRSALEIFSPDFSGESLKDGSVVIFLIR